MSVVSFVEVVCAFVFPYFSFVFLLRGCRWVHRSWKCELLKLERDFLMGSQNPCSVMIVYTNQVAFVVIIA